MCNLQKFKNSKHQFSDKRSSRSIPMGRKYQKQNIKSGSNLNKIEIDDKIMENFDYPFQFGSFHNEFVLRFKIYMSEPEFYEKFEVNNC